MATFEELQRVCKHHSGRADDFEGMETPIQNHTLRCWNCLVSLEPIPADVVAQVVEFLQTRFNRHTRDCHNNRAMADTPEQEAHCYCDHDTAAALLALLPKP